MKGSVEDSGDKGPVGDSEKTSWLLTVNFPSSIPVVGIEFVPSIRVKKPDINTPKFKFTYSWYRLERDGISRSKVGFSKTHVPENEDLGCILELECAVVNSVISGDFLVPIKKKQTEPVILPPDPHLRRMVQVGSGAHPAGSKTFKVLTYNVLSDHYSKRYHYCPKWAFTWQYRRQNLFQEIISYDADIVCLQEVQSDRFKDFYKPELEMCGYSVIYYKQTKAVSFAGKSVHDGCATFYRRDRFIEVEKHEIDFIKNGEQCVQTLPDNQKKDGIKRLNKEDVALIVVLESKEDGTFANMMRSRSSQLICVANAHIQSNPKLKDCKLMQVADLLLKVERITHNVATSYRGAAIPVLICGGLNSCPERSYKSPFQGCFKIIERGFRSGIDPPLIDTNSAVHELLASRSVSPDHPERKDHPLDIFEQTQLSHKMPLVSAYTSFLQTDREEPDVKCQQKLMDSKTKEPLCTYFTDRSVGTLDYIFYSEDTLMVDGLLELLDKELLREYTALPSPKWSSDHIALMGSFRIRPETHGSH